MESIKTHFLLLALLINSSLAHSDVISLSHDMTLPTVITSNTDFVVNFGMPGDRLDVTEIFVNATFSNNLWDPLEVLRLSYQGDPLLAWPSYAFSTKTSSETALLSLLVDDFNHITVDNDGLALFRISMSGDGTNFESLTFTANTTISPVPIPSAFYLFIGGLAFMRFAARRHNTHNKTFSHGHA